MSFMDDRKEQLLITEIERAAFHDGPGIRTTVFMAGCPLRCPWCCNPETQQLKRILLHDIDRCIGCGNCVEVCPVGAATMQNGKPIFNQRSCNFCEECVNTCPVEALSLSGKYMTVEEIMKEVLCDLAYYEATGGGITLSGGEPFFQARGALRLLTLAKQNGLHTAVETTAFVDTEILRTALPLVDLFMIDIKHADAASLKTVTGADLNIISMNIHMLVSLGADVLLRTPVIPNFNNTPDTIRNIFELDLKLGVNHAVLLPYHSLAKSKYKKLSLPYQLGDLAMISNAELEPLAEIGRRMGLKVTIGDNEA